MLGRCVSAGGGSGDVESAGALAPLFAAEALREGFLAVHALPMRIRSDTIGALNLFRTTVGTLSDADIRAARALADGSTLIILAHRGPSDPQLLARQIQQALKMRVVIEQAKGVLAERAKVNMEEAFLLLRPYARGTINR